jgi:hypothetical protein
MTNGDALLEILEVEDGHAEGIAAFLLSYDPESREIVLRDDTDGKELYRRVAIL